MDLEMDELPLKLYIEVSDLASSIFLISSKPIISRVVGGWVFGFFLFKASLFFQDATGKPLHDSDSMRGWQSIS